MPSPRSRRLAAVLTGGVLVASCSATSSSPPAQPSPPPSSASTTPTSSAPPPPATLHARLAPWRLPAARSREVALSTAAGLVVAGGLSSAHVSTSTIWTLSTNGRLVQSGSLAVPVHDATGLVVNRIPFVIAGGNTTTVGDVQRISSSDQARVVGRLPQPRSDLSATYVEGGGYVLGGFDGATSLSQVLHTSDGQHYTPSANLRVTVRYAAVAGVVTSAGDQLLVFGGEHDGVPIDDVQDVDLQTGHTRIVGHLPQPLAHEAAFSLGNDIWLAGGRSHDQLQFRIWRWDPRHRRAVAAGRLPYAVADSGVAGDGVATAYLLGGETPEPTDRVILLSVR